MPLDTEPESDSSDPDREPEADLVDERHLVEEPACVCVRLALLSESSVSSEEDQSLAILRQPGTLEIEQYFLGLWKCRQKRHREENISQ